MPGLSFLRAFLTKGSQSVPANHAAAEDPSLVARAGWWADTDLQALRSKIFYTPRTRTLWLTLHDLTTHASVNSITKRRGFGEVVFRAGRRLYGVIDTRKRCYGVKLPAHDTTNYEPIRFITCTVIFRNSTLTPSCNSWAV